MNPNDRDRGLRLVATLTSAVTAISLVAIGLTTSLAASATRQRDELRIVSAKASGTLVEAKKPTAQRTGATTPRSKQRKKPAAATTTAPRTTHTVSTSTAKVTQTSAKRTASTKQPSTQPTMAPAASTTTKQNPKPQSTTSTHTPTAKVSTVPPAVPSTGS